MTLRACAILAVLTCCAAIHADAARTAQCDALLESAVRRPYGWAWPGTEEPATPSNRPLPHKAVVVSFRPGATPTAALLLHEAGTALNREAYRNAAREAARAILAAQEPMGRIPAGAVFGTTVTRTDATESIPDRAPTCAALGLLLRMVETGVDDERLRRGAARAALWLMRQQTPTGLWPSPYVPENPDDPDDRPGRFVRLDQRDYRDCTIALLYAGRVLNDKVLVRAGERSARQLVRLGLSQSRSARGLWHTAYELSGQPSQRLANHAWTIDALATRYCLQTLLVARLMTGEAEFLEVLRPPVASIQALRYDDGLWLRLYQIRDGEVERPAGPAPRPDGGFFVNPDEIPELDRPGTFGLPQTLRAIEMLMEQKVGTCAPALTLVGLTDHPEVAEPPSP